MIDKFATTLILCIVFVNPIVLYYPLDVNEQILSLTNIQVSSEEIFRKDVFLEAFAVHQVEASVIPLEDADTDDVLVRIEVWSYVRGHIDMSFRRDLTSINGTYTPRSSDCYVKIENLGHIEEIWVNLTITQISDPVTFSLPSDGPILDIPFQIFITTIAPLLMLIFSISIKRRRIQN